MRGLWLENQHLSFCSDVPDPAPAKDQALIHMRLAGVCSTDLELVKGYYPFSGIPGHEFVGQVVRSPGDPTWEGKRVVGEINIACGSCDMCQRGLPRHCEHRRALGIHDWNGAFTEYLVLPIANLHEVPDRLPDQVAVFTEPVAAAYEILEQISLSRNERVLVIGTGRLGQLVAQVLQTSGCHLEAVSRNPKQQRLLIERNISTISSSELPSHRYDLVVEASGSPDGYALARQAVRPRGVIILKSTYKGQAQADFSSLVVDEVTLIGSRCGPFEPALKLLAEHKVDPLPLVEAIYPLEQGVQALEQAAQPGILKVLLQS